MHAAPMILVVEDHVIMRRLVRVTLEEAGYRVCDAGTGREALACVEAHTPALILQDLHLPDMDGVELVRTLRGMPVCKSIPIFALSGMHSKLEETRPLRAGFDDYLLKPISRADLLSLVAASLAPVG